MLQAAYSPAEDVESSSGRQETSGDEAANCQKKPTLISPSLQLALDIAKLVVVIIWLVCIVYWIFFSRPWLATDTVSTDYPLRDYTCVRCFEKRSKGAITDVLKVSDEDVFWAVFLWSITVPISPIGFIVLL
jgi:hypothetical protein